MRKLPRMSRRRFVIGAGLAAGAGLVAPISIGSMPAAAAPASPIVEGRLLHREDFAPLVGDIFEVGSGMGRHVELRLHAVLDPKPVSTRNSASRHPQPRTENFMIEFRGAGEALAQDTYQLAHGRLGRFTLFMAPR